MARVYLENHFALKKIKKLKELYPESNMQELENFIKNTKESRTIYLLNKKIPLQ
jgi:hypothetical protein